MDHGDDSTSDEVYWSNHILCFFSNHYEYNNIDQLSSIAKLLFLRRVSAIYARPLSRQHKHVTRAKLRLVGIPYTLMDRQA